MALHCTTVRDKTNSGNLKKSSGRSRTVVEVTLGVTTAHGGWYEVCCDDYIYYPNFTSIHCFSLINIIYYI